MRIVTSREYPECDLCGVFYDVGAKECRESFCVTNNAVREVKVQKKTKKRYKQKKIPKEVSRLTSIKSRAKKRNLECDLDIQDVQQLIVKGCIYCGSQERIEIDRMDNSKGYIKTNVAPACRRCNTIKNNVVTYEEMMTIVDILGWRNND